MALVRSREELVEDMYKEIKYLLRAMARDIANPSYWQLQYDEVLAELQLKMVLVVHRYAEKPFNEIKALVIKSLHHYKKDLMAAVYGTYRADELGALDIDANEEIIPGIVGIFLVDDFLVDLPTEDSRKLVMEILQPSERTRRFVELAITKKSHVSYNNGWKMEITPFLMERALGWDEKRLEAAWMAVAETFAEYVL